MGFYFQDDMYEAVSELPEKAKEQVIIAIVRYYFEGVEPTFKGSRQALFTAFKKRIDMSKANAKRQGKYRDKRRDVKRDSNVTRYVTNDVTPLLREGEREVITNVITTPQTPQGGCDGEADAAFIADAISAFNAETGQDVRDLDVSTMESLRRIREQGRTVDDLRAVARFKAMQWRGDRRMCRFVRPSTLFGGKFEEYLAETREEAEHERRFAKYD